MIQLTTNFSDALLDLLGTNDALVDAIEVGPWYSLKQIRRLQTQLPGWQFHFHAGNVITKIGFVPGTIRHLKAYLRCTSSLWTSCHITLLRPGYIWLALRFGRYLPPPNTATETERFVRRVAQLARILDIPILLENMPAPPDEKKRYAFDADPDLINEILTKTHCNMLLDLAHARVAAAGKEMDVHDYLDLLPLEKVVQIHVSGPRMRNGYLCDAHEPLQEVDYALLEWTLERTKPKLLTLEYFKKKGPLRVQLTRLRTMIDSPGNRS